MKVKPISQKKEALVNPLNPMQRRDVFDYPVVMRDSPDDLPEITQDDLVGYANALYRFQVAKAHYELLRASLTVKFLARCRVEPGDESAYYDEDNDRIVQVEDRRDHRDRLRR